MKCCIADCFNYYEAKQAKFSFFKFPSDPVLLKAWMDVIPEKSHPIWENSRICSTHFLEVDFMYYRGGRRLNKESIPSIFNAAKWQMNDPIETPMLEDTTDIDVDPSEDLVEFSMVNACTTDVSMDRIEDMVECYMVVESPIELHDDPAEEMIECDVGEKIPARCYPYSTEELNESVVIPETSVNVEVDHVPNVAGPSTNLEMSQQPIRESVSPVVSTR